jgi:hypothetical protein
VAVPLNQLDDPVLPLSLGMQLLGLIVVFHKGIIGPHPFLGNREFSEEMVAFDQIMIL